VRDLPLVSVVVPNYNYALYVGKCIESILAQTYMNIEIIVVDDGSTDDSLEILNRYDDKVKVIQSQNFGVNHARNLGLRYCSGEYVAFCDSDDYWESEKIQLQLDLMRQNSNLSLVYTGVNVVEINSVKTTHLEPCFRGVVDKSILRYPSRAIVLLGASTALLKTSHLKEKNISWNEALKLPGEDINFFNKVALATQIDYVDKPLVNYRQHISSRSKMSLADFIQGNRESFVDFAGFAMKYIGYGELHLSWMRLNLIFLKHALSCRNYMTALKQATYFLRLIPIQDRSNLRDRAKD